jgi:single-strand DNA-binding protein
MSGVNKAIIVGHLGSDPEVKTGATGVRVATFSVATGEAWRDKATGERKEITDWHRVVIFNEALVKIAEQYLKKGSKVYIEGKMKTRKWTDQGGQDRYTTEVVLQNFTSLLVLLDRAERGAPSEDDYGAARTSPPAANDGAGKSDMNDEIPF